VRTHSEATGLGRKFFRNAILATLTGVAAVALCSTQSPSPSSAPDWQAAAGGKMAFDVASVKRNTSASPRGMGSNFPLGPGDVYVPNGGVFRATNLPLVDYIAFAYKVPENQGESLLSQLGARPGKSQQGPNAADDAIRARGSLPAGGSL
jgi:hypothetical protein